MTSFEEIPMKTRQTFLSILIAAAVALVMTTVSQAKDTDIYLKVPASTSSDDAPNVLIILDNSISMTSTVPAADYDANTTYTYGGAGTAFDPLKIYWKNSSQAQPTSAAQYPGQSFLISDNHCKRSTVPNAYSTADLGGGYNDDVVSWKPGWSAISSSDSGFRVDCKADHADNAADDSAGSYLRKTSTTIQYTNSSSSAQKYSFSGSSPVTLYSGNYLNFKSNPVSTTQTKLSVAKTVINNIIDTNPGVRFGLMTFNKNMDTSYPPDEQADSGGRVVFPISTMDATKRTQFHAIVNSLGADTFTPLAETMYEAYLYLSGQAPRFGTSTNPTNPVAAASAQSAGKYISPILYPCQKTFIILVTDGDPTQDENADSLIDALPDIAAATLPDYYAGRTVPIGGVNYNMGSTGHKDRLAVLTKWLYDNDMSPDASGGLKDKQNVVTFTVGFDVGTGPSAGIHQEGVDLLTLAGNNGTGGFKSAADANELTSTLQAALIDIQTSSTTFTAPALSVNAFNTLFNRDDVYFAMFVASGSRRWDGNIKKYTLCKNTAATGCKYGEIMDADSPPKSAVDSDFLIVDGAKSYWSSVADGDDVKKGGAGSKIPTSANRNIYTYTGSYEADNILPTGSAPVDLTAAAHEVKTSNAALTSGLLGAASGTERNNLINWIRGQDVFDENGVNGTTDERNWMHYDPMHSRPVLVNYGGDATTPILKIFVGTNDGMVRMIDESTGVEEWAFLPQELLAQQKSIAPNGNGDHIWGMDGTPTFDIYDRSKNSSGTTIDVPDGVIDPAIGDYVHMYIGMRRGGRNIYALDVTPVSAMTSSSKTINPKLMWAIRGGTSTGYNALAQSWSRPQVAKIRMATGGGTAGAADEESATTKVVIFGGGYDTATDSVLTATTTTQGNAIFIANATTGERIWWASSDVGATLTLSNMQFSIPSDLTLLDANGDGAVDRVYVGDVGGQVWRLDLSPTLAKNKNGGSSGYVFADLACTSGSRPSCAGTADQDRRRFFYPPDVAQVNDSIYGSTTAPEYDIVTISSGDREDPLDNHTVGLATPVEAVHNRLYALRDPNIDALGTAGAITYPATIKDSNLYNATSNALQSATSTVIDGSGIRTSKGWFINFVSSGSAWVGEKSLARTSIFGGTLYATTFTPADDSTPSTACQADTGKGLLYAVNILNGAATFDLDGAAGLSTSDRTTGVGSGIPAEHVVVIRPGGNSDLVGTASPGAVNKTLQRDKTFWYQK